MKIRDKRVIIPVIVLIIILLLILIWDRKEEDKFSGVWDWENGNSSYNIYKNGEFYEMKTSGGVIYKKGEIRKLEIYVKEEGTINGKFLVFPFKREEIALIYDDGKIHMYTGKELPEEQNKFSKDGILRKKE